jgi:hypothetical protein
MPIENSNSVIRVERSFSNPNLYRAELRLNPGSGIVLLTRLVDMRVQSTYSQGLARCFSRRLPPGIACGVHVCVH